MNWDKGFKRLYIALSVLFFIGSLFFSYGETEMYNRIHAEEEDGLRKSTVRWLAITPVYLRSNTG